MPHHPVPPPQAVRVALLLALGLSATGGCSQPRQVSHRADVQALVAASGARGPSARIAFQPLAPGEVVALPPAPPAPAPYRIGAGDVMHVAVPKEAAFLKFGETSRGDVIGTRVKTNGKLYLPILGGVDAAGKTVVELQEELQAQVTEKFGAGTYVAVELLEYRSQRFYVLGDVGKPGVYPVDGETTLLGGVAAAQGLNQTAAVEDAFVLRAGRVLPISLGDVLLRGDVARNVVMQDGDLIFVPHGADQKVYVVGEVLKPGVVPMARGRLTLAEAVASAGGLDRRYADANSIRVFRGGWAHPESYTLSAHELWRFGDDIALRSGDRVVVQPTELATWGRAMALVFPYIQGTASTALSAAALTVAAQD